MNTITRAYIKNQDRLDLLERSIISWFDKELNDLGDLYILDDISPEPYNRLIYDLCKKYNINYVLAKQPSCTINGLVESLKLNHNEPILCTVDDMVYGKGIKEAIIQTFKTIEEINLDWGLIGFFACYEKNTRNHFKVHGTELWHIPNDILYALVCHIFNPKLSKILINEWKDILDKKIPEPGCHDDIWVAKTCTREGIKNFNHQVDFALHTGANKRTFTDNPVDEWSEYQTPKFIGE